MQPQPPSQFEREYPVKRAVYAAISALPDGRLKRLLEPLSYEALRGWAVALVVLSVWSVLATGWALAATFTRPRVVQPAELGVIAGQSAGDVFRAQARAAAAERGKRAEAEARELCEASWSDLVETHARTLEAHVGMSRVLTVRPDDSVSRDPGVGD